MAVKIDLLCDVDSWDLFPLNLDHLHAVKIFLIYTFLRWVLLFKHVTLVQNDRWQYLVLAMMTER